MPCCDFCSWIFLMWLVMLLLMMITTIIIIIPFDLVEAVVDGAGRQALA